MGEHVWDVPRALEAMGIEARLRGVHWHGKCPSPAHTDHTPSWSVRDQPGHEKHGFHHCFSCNFEGGLIALVAEVVGISNQGAYAWLVEHASEKPRAALDVAWVVNRPKTKARFELPAGVVLAPLEKWVTPARRYAVKRGLTAEQVDRWGLGYAIDGRLAGRIVIPVRGQDGLIRSYTGRSYVDHPNKYLKPKEEEGPDPSVMFGEQGWPAPQPGLRSTLVVLEGELNALAVERVGIPALFACLQGSYLNAFHVLKLTSFERAIICTDNDPAGDQAAEFLTQGLERHMVLDRLRLPKGLDPCDLEPQDLRKEFSRWFPLPIRWGISGVTPGVVSVPTRARPCLRNCWPRTGRRVEPISSR